MEEKKSISFGYSGEKTFRCFAGTIFTVIFVLLVAVFIDGCTKSSSYDPLIGDPLSSGIQTVLPLNKASGTFVDPVVAVTFKEGTDPAVISSANISIRKGTAAVPGSVQITGSTASFIADSDLDSDCEYSATVDTKPTASNVLDATHQYSWKFSTGKFHRVDSLSVVSVVPGDKAINAGVNLPVQVTFNQALTANMMKSVSISLKKGTTAVSGTISYLGKTATFTPAANLSDGSVYTGKVSIVRSQAYADKSGQDFSWSFTTSGTAADVTAPVISSVVPANNATTVAIGSTVTATFNEAMNATTISASTFTLKQGTTAVAGAVTYTGTTATFTPTAALSGNTTYTATISTGVKDVAGNALKTAYTWSFKTAAVIDVTAPTVLSVVPASSSTGASTTTKATITFSEAMAQATINTSTFTLKQGSASITGTVAYSGTTATFTPSATLAASTVYTATISTAATDAAGNALASNYTWSFTTAAAADVTPPTISSVNPLLNATAVAVTVKPTATFSETMDASTISSSTFTLKQGSVSVAGTVSYSGTIATFTPTVSLSGSTVYTATITTGVKDVSGNALATSYSWSFTTATPADVTPPAIGSVTPASSATSIALNTVVSASFSEAMNASTITSSTFTMKQGSTAVAGNVTYSGTTATFTPSAALTGNTVYTCTITTGVKDVAGNAMASNYTWSFTTVATVTGKSFASDVMPVLNLCNTCHTHGWTPSSTASVFYSNLLSAGYINATTPTSGKIYSKLSGGHPPGSTVSAAQVTTVLTWITEGSKNN